MKTEEFNLSPDGIAIKGKVYAPDAPASPLPAIILCHGIPRGIPAPGDPGYASLVERFISEGFIMVYFNFRGTGESGGNFDMLGWTRDLRAVIDHLETKPDVDKNRITLMGFSGGAAAAIYTAAHDQRVSNLVSCACPARFLFARDDEMVVILIEHSRQIGTIRDLDFPPSIAEWQNGFLEIEPEKWIPRISPRPLLILHGTSDDTVPLDHAFELHRAAGEPKEMQVVEGAEHRLRESPRTIDYTLAWLKKNSK
jgi:dipeptidyl aminopeptidase/acylaminoacyl peptidase